MRKPPANENRLHACIERFHGNNLLVPPFSRALSLTTAVRFLAGTLLLAGPGVMTPGLIQAQSLPRESIVYTNSFERSVGLGWSSSKTSETPNGARKFLGDFGTENIALTLSELPGHTAVIVTFDLLIIGSWDGNGEYCCGPDIFEFGAAGAQNLLHTTFSAHDGTAGGPIQYQTYPGNHPGRSTPPYTSATEINSLGYFSFLPWGDLPTDAVYSMRFVIPHSTSNVTLNFAGLGLEELANESWGLDNVGVTVIDAPAGVFQFGQPGYVFLENTTNATVTVFRAGGTRGAVTVDYATRNGTALALSDYRPLTGTLSFADGESEKSIALFFANNPSPENDETFEISLANPTSGAVLGSAKPAAIRILDDDGSFEFVQTNHVIAEIDRYVSVTIFRTSATNRPQSIAFRTLVGTAQELTDFFPETNTLSFPPGVTVNQIFLQIRDDPLAEIEETFSLQISPGSGYSELSRATNATVMILDNDEPQRPGRGANWDVYTAALQPDGKWLVGGGFRSIDGQNRLHIGRLLADGTLDPTFDPGVGPDNWIEAIAVQSDGLILAGGWFSDFAGAGSPHLARLKENGQIDPSFKTDDGPNGPIFAIVVQPDGRIIVGGQFTQFNGLPRNGICRLNPDGSVDNNFRVGSGIEDGSIWSLALQSDRRVLAVGNFVAFNGMLRFGIVRLNADGSVDTRFDPGLGANDTVQCLALQSDGQIVIGGSFTTFNGTARNRIARLNSSGLLDSTFRTATGADEPVNNVRIQPDGKILIGGEFTSVDGVRRSGIAQLQANGAIDPSFDPGAGANSSVFFIVPLANEQIGLAGSFTSFADQPRYRLALLHPSGGILPVERDVEPPLLLAAGSYGRTNEIILSFSEPLDPASAVIPLNYSLTPALAAASAAWDPTRPNEVVLKTAGNLGSTPYSIATSNLQDRSGNSLVGAAKITVQSGPAVPLDLGQRVSGFQDDFDGATRNTNWVPRTGLNRGRGIDLYTQTNGLLRVRNGADDPNHLLLEIPGYDRSVQEVLARIRLLRFGSGDGSRAGIATSVSFTNNPDNVFGYFGINYHFRTLEWNSQSRGKFVQFLSDYTAWGPDRDYPWTTNQWFWMRMRHAPNLKANQADVFAKSWPADGMSPEPADWFSWDYTPFNAFAWLVDPARAGYAGIAAGSLSALAEFEVDYILIKADGLPQIQTSTRAFPLAAPSEFRLAISRAPNAAGFMHLIFEQPGSVVIHASTDLQNWLPVFTNSSSETLKQWTDPASSSLPLRFYRAFSPSPPSP